MLPESDPAPVQFPRSAVPCKIRQCKICFLSVFCHSFRAADIMPHTQQQIINMNHLHLPELFLTYRKSSRQYQKLRFLPDPVILFNQLHQRPGKPPAIHFQIQILIRIMFHFIHHRIIIILDPPIKLIHNHRIPKLYVITVKLRITIPEP